MTRPDFGRVVACPDGSIDTVVAVHDVNGRVASRAEFGRRVAAGERSFRFVPRRRVPGGQSVTAARQAHRLGAETALFGHCDDPLFEFPFRVESLGDPAAVTVCTFGGEDLMLATDSADLAACDADRLRDAGAYDAPADAVCVSNAVSVPAVDDVLRGFGAGDAPVVFDPGSITSIDAERAGRLRDALRDLGTGREVVVTPNADETEAFAAALGIGGDAAGVAGPLRDALGVAAVVVHSHPASVVADADGTREVAAPDVERTARTGAGDCFVGGLTAALSGGWNLDAGVELGNRCAAHRVATDDFAGRADLL